MLSKIIGVFWIFAGILWSVKPHMLKNWLGRKVNRKMRRVLFGALIVMGLSISASAMKTPGIIPKIAVVLGLFLAIKGIMFLTSKTSEKLLGWWSERPVYVFRIQGVIALIVGIALLVF